MAAVGGVRHQPSPGTRRARRPGRELPAPGDRAGSPADPDVALAQTPHGAGAQGVPGAVVR